MLRRMEAYDVQMALMLEHTTKPIVFRAGLPSSDPS